jgi:lipid-A-disaccharide synthase
VPLHLIEGDDEKFAAFDAANAALAASGTVTTELALSGTPMVVGYKVGWLTYVLALPLMNVRYITLINVLLDRQAVPEYLQTGCTAAALTGAVTTLLTDEGASLHERADLEEATKMLGKGGEAPSLRAARAIVDFIRGDQRLLSGT